jgi:hypothetical protein
MSSVPYPPRVGYQVESRVSYSNTGPSPISCVRSESEGRKSTGSPTVAVGSAQRSLRPEIERREDPRLRDGLGDGTAELEVDRMIAQKVAAAEAVEFDVEGAVSAAHARPGSDPGRDRA